MSGKREGRLLTLAVGVLACAARAGVLAGAAPASTRQLVVSLTFDDGYANQAVTAAPILAAHGMQGTFYVPSGFVGSSGYMTWAQVSALAAAGNEIGGHTVDHVDLPTVSADQARHEICADRDTLLQHGLAVTDFAYPYGDFNSGVESIVQECGYNSARTTSWYGSTCGRPCTESIPPRDPYTTTIVAFRRRPDGDGDRKQHRDGRKRRWLGASPDPQGLRQLRHRCHVARGPQCATRLARAALGTGNRRQDGGSGDRRSGPAGCRPERGCSFDAVAAERRGGRRDRDVAVVGACFEWGFGGVGV